MNIEIREYTQDDVKDMIEIWNEVVEKDKEEIIKNVQQKIHEKDKKYFAVIKVETSYI